LFISVSFRLTNYTTIPTPYQSPFSFFINTQHRENRPLLLNDFSLLKTNARQFEIVFDKEIMVKEKVNEMERIFAIGDIHGCLNHLTNLIQMLDINTEDTLVFIGDYIDRGPDSKGVLDFILDLKKDLKKVICLRGNHEEMFLNFYLGRKDALLFLRNGGQSTLASYGMLGKSANGIVGKLPDTHLQFLKSLPLYFETEDYIFVHAGLRPGISLKQQDPCDLLWIRDEFIFSTVDFGKIVVFGHTPFREPFFQMHNKIGIDTGAVYWGKLTCIELPDQRIYQT